MKKIFLIATMLLSGSLAWGHAHLLATGTFPNRNINADIKTAPCGLNNDVRSLTPVNYQPGATVPIQFEEFIQHTGRFEVYFISGGQRTLLKTIADDQDGPTPPNHQFSNSITLPNVSCVDCTIQLVQVMLDNHPLNPTYYYSCSDIVLSTGAPPPPPVSPQPQPPVVGPVLPPPNCH